MRARRLRPSFEILGQRITPSDTTSIITGLDPWVVTGTPQDEATNVLQPTVDPTQVDCVAA